jgi:hypothetical protein
MEWEGNIARKCHQNGWQWGTCFEKKKKKSFYY